jgi:hypothetical protein
VKSALRHIGIINAAVWFGGLLFFAFGILPAVFSQDTRRLFQDGPYPWFSGGVAMILFCRCFVLQYCCGAIAILHIILSYFYFGGRFPKANLLLVLALFAIALVGGLWLQPHLESLRQNMYFGASTDIKTSARHAFGLWHGLSQLVNLFVLIGLLANLIMATKAPMKSGY